MSSFSGFLGGLPCFLIKIISTVKLLDTWNHKCISGRVNSVCNLQEKEGTWVFNAQSTMEKEREGGKWEKKRKEVWSSQGNGLLSKLSKNNLEESCRAQVKSSFTLWPFSNHTMAVVHRSGLRRQHSGEGKDIFNPTFCFSVMGLVGW